MVIDHWFCLGFSHVHTNLNIVVIHAIYSHTV